MKRSRFKGIFTPFQIRSLVDQYFVTNTTLHINTTTFEEPKKTVIKTVFFKLKNTIICTIQQKSHGA